MYIRRSYAQSFYRKRRQTNLLMIVTLLTSIAAIVAVASSQFDRLQASALQSVGMAPLPTAFAGEYAQLAAEKFVRGDLEGARADYAKAVAQQPTNVSYLYEYGGVLLELAEADMAVTVADQAIAADANDVRGYALKANALAWEDPGGAIPVAKQGVYIDPNYSPLYAAMTIAYNNLSFYTLALENGQKAIALDPNNPGAYRAYAWPLIYTANYALAIENLETAISISPNLTGSYFELAFWYQHGLKDTSRSVGVYERILSLNPSTADAAKANLRICEMMSQAERVDFGKAEPFCQESIRLKPDYGSAYRQLGRMRYLRRNYEGAIEAFETCVALGATDIECWHMRGLAHYWMGQCDQAWTVLNEAAVRAADQGEGQGTIDDINQGLENTRINCPAYQNMPSPTPILPTAIPPTPIGGL